MSVDQNNIPSFQVYFKKDCHTLDFAPPFECPHKLDWTRESNVWLSLLLGDLRSAERKTSKCASERTSLMQRKKNNVLSFTKKNEKKMHILDISGCIF